MTPATWEEMADPKDPYLKVIALQLKLAWSYQSDAMLTLPAWECPCCQSCQHDSGYQSTKVKHCGTVVSQQCENQTAVKQTP